MEQRRIRLGRATVIALITAMALVVTLLATGATSAEAADDEVIPPACPLTEGTILIGDGTDWGPGFIQANLGAPRALFLDIPVEL
ncbi:MAG: hypothetical protein QNJ71_09535, partial [Acidimicrobiia bacterium]|nr:hypothetical protein [Acidimicrobiia bacterium]